MQLTNTQRFELFELFAILLLCLCSFICLPIALLGPLSMAILGLSQATIIGCAIAWVFSVIILSVLFNR